MVNNYIEIDDLVENSSTRIPVCVCVDTSGSMFYKDNTEQSRIDRLKDGIFKLVEELKNNNKTKDSVELALVTFNKNAEINQDFKIINKIDEGINFTVGKTGDIAKGVEKSLEVLQQRKELYKENGIDYYQPWLVLMTDGKSTGENHSDVNNRLHLMQQEVLKLEQEKKISVILVYVGKNDDKNAINDLSGFSRINPVIKISEDFSFEDFFEWLGKSVNKLEVDVSSLKESISIPNISSWDDI